MVDHDFALCGTVDQIKRKMESLAQCHGDGELEWFSWLAPQGLLPWDDVRRQMETFAAEILPEFKS